MKETSACRRSLLAMRSRPQDLVIPRFIYVLRDGTGGPRYVGQTTMPNGRLSLHLSDARGAFRSGTMTPKQAWCLEHEGRVVLEVVASRICSGATIGRLEARWIRKLSLRGAQLFNIKHVPDALKRPENTGSHGCGYCRKSGHNTRTCAELRATRAA